MSMFRVILSSILLTATMAKALTIVGYDSATNDRFSSGYPNNPVANAGPDQELCEPNTSTTFAGSALIFPATGTWTSGRFRRAKRLPGR